MTAFEWLYVALYEVLCWGAMLFVAWPNVWPLFPIAGLGFMVLRWSVILWQAREEDRG